MFALADQVITADDGKKSIIGIFDKIFVRTLPAHHPRMVLFIAIAGEVDAQGSLWLKFLAPASEKLETKELPFQLGDNGKANIIVNLEGYPIQATGLYQMVLEYDEKELGRYAFEAIRVEEQAERTLVG